MSFQPPSKYVYKLVRSQVHRFTHKTELIPVDETFSREQARDLARLDRQRLRIHSNHDEVVEYHIINVCKNKIVESVYHA